MYQGSSRRALGEKAKSVFKVALGLVSRGLGLPSAARAESDSSHSRKFVLHPAVSKERGGAHKEA